MVAGLNPALAPHIQATFVHNILKLYSRLEEVDTEIDAMVSFLNQIGPGRFGGVMGLFAFSHQLFSYFYPLWGWGALTLRGQFSNPAGQSFTLYNLNKITYQKLLLNIEETSHATNYQIFLV